MQQLSGKIDNRQAAIFYDSKYMSFGISFMLHAIFALLLLGFFVKKQELLEIEIKPLLIIGSESKKSHKIVKNIIPLSDKPSQIVTNKNPAQNNKAQGQTLKNDYANLIANKLDRQKDRFDMTMAPMDKKTQVLLKVHLDENGKLISQEIIQHSGNKFFDKTAKS